MSAIRRPPTLSSPRHRTGTSSLLGRSSLRRCTMRAGRPDQPLQRGLAAHEGARGIVAVRGTWLTRRSHGSGPIGPSARDRWRDRRFRNGFQLFGSRLFRRLVAATNARHAPTGKLIIGPAKSAESRTITVLGDAATWTQLPFPMLRRDLRHMLA
jgi:hypothetical protein